MEKISKKCKGYHLALGKIQTPEKKKDLALQRRLPLQKNGWIGCMVNLQHLCVLSIEIATSVFHSPKCLTKHKVFIMLSKCWESRWSIKWNYPEQTSWGQNLHYNTKLSTKDYRTRCSEKIYWRHWTSDEWLPTWIRNWARGCAPSVETPPPLCPTYCVHQYHNRVTNTSTNAHVTLRSSFPS